jgi:hypothetical protein
VSSFLASTAHQIKDEWPPAFSSFGNPSPVKPVSKQGLHLKISEIGQDLKRCSGTFPRGSSGHKLRGHWGGVLFHGRYKLYFHASVHTDDLLENLLTR